MSLRGRDLAALLLAAVAAIAGLVAWSSWEVHLGLTLETDESGWLRVVHVAPGSIAAEHGIVEGQVVTALEAIDGQQVRLLEPVPIPEEFGGGEIALPAEPLPEELIGFVSFGEEYEDGTILPDSGMLYAPAWQNRLAGSGWLTLFGAGGGALVAFALSRGWLGTAWRAEGIPFGSAVAIPFMAAPLLYAGTPDAAAAPLVLAAAGTLPAARSLAEGHPVERWPGLLFGVSVVLASTVGLNAFRVLTAVSSASGDSVDLVLLLATIAFVPALAVAFAVDRPPDERAELLLIGLAPGAAAAILGTTYPNPLPFIGWVVIALGWRRARSWVSRFGSFVQRPADQVALRSMPPLAEAEDSGWRVAGLHGRDLMALVVAGAAAFSGGLLSCCDTSALIVGSALGVAVGIALRRGFMGPAWTQAAIPVGCAVAIPILGVGLMMSGGEQSSGLAVVLSTLGALPVAFLLASRHPDPSWRRLLPYLAGAIALAALFVTLQFRIDEPPWYGSGLPERYLLMGSIALVPGLVVAFTSSPVAAGSVTHRLDTLAIATTPGAAMTVLVPSFGPFLLVAWLVGLMIIWRRLTIAPLLGLAVRTQRQRDLAVVAVEAERARLAADLHDDALQELSALVRRLDAAGDAEGAELARGVAERLRAITSDLRLPLLDDLGAGPALEWLVGRVRPLADGEVRLERADPHRPPAGVELAVFRVAQEALANAVKHGKPPITVRYRVDEAGGVSLSVDDEGPGIDATAAEEALHAGHLGVANMQQRAEQIGALLDIRRWPTGGTHVALEWRPR